MKLSWGEGEDGKSKIIMVNSTKLMKIMFVFFLSLKMSPGFSLCSMVIITTWDSFHKKVRTEIIVVHPDRLCFQHHPTLELYFSSQACVGCFSCLIKHQTFYLSLGISRCFRVLLTYFLADQVNFHEG